MEYSKDSYRTMIHAGWLIDGSGKPARQNRLIVVERGIVRAIVDARESPDRAEALRSGEWFDLSRCVVLPGLVDAHLHLFMSGTADPDVRRRQLDASFAEIRPVIEKHLSRLSAHGVIAVRDGGDYGGHALRYKTECAEKLPEGMTVRAAGRALRAQGRYGRLIGRPPLPGQCLADAVIHRIDSMIDPVDHVKIVNSGLNSLTDFGRETASQFEEAELRAAVTASHERSLKVMVHCNGAAPVAIAVKAGCDSVEHGFFMGEENLKRMAGTGTVWVPTAVTMKAYSRMLPENTPEANVAHKNFTHQRAQIRRARELGVRIALGTDAGSLGVHHGRAVGEELAILTDAGFSIEQAVACSARVGGELLGLEDSGELRKGRPARFIAVDGPPERLAASLADCRHFKFSP